MHVLVVVVTPHIKLMSISSHLWQSSLYRSSPDWGSWTLSFIGGSRLVTSPAVLKMAPKLNFHCSGPFLNSQVVNGFTAMNIVHINVVIEDLFRLFFSQCLRSRRRYFWTFAGLYSDPPVSLFIWIVIEKELKLNRKSCLKWNVSVSLTLKYKCN